MGIVLQNLDRGQTLEQSLDLVGVSLADLDGRRDQARQLNQIAALADDRVTLIIESTENSLPRRTRRNVRTGGPQGQLDGTIPYEDT